MAERLLSMREALGSVPSARECGGQVCVPSGCCSWLGEDVLGCFRVPAEVRSPPTETLLTVGLD